MQISKISAQSFGCKQCRPNKSNNESCNKAQTNAPSKAIAVTRNALLTALTGILASSCQQANNDLYYFGITPEGNPYIYNQDGDMIDIIPSDVEDEYKVFADKNK